MTGGTSSPVVDDPRGDSVNPNKALWEKGDFTRIATSMRESREALVATLGITEGLEVLDLGCGDGTTAVPEARLGANVLGVDIARNLVEAGNARAQQLGLANCRFEEGDATDLHDLEDDRFDLVVSIFHQRTAARHRCAAVPFPHEFSAASDRVSPSLRCRKWCADALVVCAQRSARRQPAPGNPRLIG